ncbi:MAG: GNAT family N-acetyltransferase [Thiohalospira sp.]
MIDQTGIALRDLEPRDAAPLVRLAEMATSASWTEEFVLWKYFHNPIGNITGTCADAEGSLVGFYGGVPVGIKLGDQRILGAQAADAMVSPKMRRRGLFSRMGHHTIHRLGQAGTHVIYAIANPVSRVGSVKYLDFTYPGEIPTYVKILDPAAIAAATGLEGLSASFYRALLRAVHLSRPPQSPPDEGIRVRELSAFDHRFDQLWADVSSDVDIAVVRDVPYLTWRYVENPLQRYLILAAERGEALLGYTVLSFRDAEHKGVLAIAELLVRPSERSAGLALLREASRRAAQFGCGQLQCWMLPQYSFYTRLLQQSGFVHSPSRLLPGIFRQTTSFITRLPEGATMTPDPTELCNWFLTMGDQDYY